MEKRIVTVEVTRYYSKSNTVQIEVESSLVGEDLIEFLTENEELNDLYEDAISETSLVGDDTVYEFQDPTNNFGGTL
jgi:hypothetical protein